MNKYSALRLLMLEAGLAKVNLNTTEPDAWYCNWNEPVQNPCYNTTIYYYV